MSEFTMKVVIGLLIINTVISQIMINNYDKEFKRSLQTIETLFKTIQIIKRNCNGKSLEN